MTNDVHVKQEEWVYPTKNSVSRKRAKRLINKAKRRMISKEIKRLVEDMR